MASSSLAAGANQPSLPTCVSAPWLSSASSYSFKRSVRALCTDESTAPVQVEDVRFRLQEGLDGSGIRALCLRLSVRRPVHIHDIWFRL